MEAFGLGDWTTEPSPALPSFSRLQPPIPLSLPRPPLQEFERGVPGLRGTAEWLGALTPPPFFAPDAHPPIPPCSFPVGLWPQGERRVPGAGWRGAQGGAAVQRLQDAAHVIM